MSAYLLNIFIFMGIYSILAVSLNLTVGVTGLLNLGHIGLFAIGAYTSALLTTAGIPFVLAFLLAGIFTSMFGYGLVYATKKLKGDYFALATLAFSFVTYSVLLNWTSLTRGPLGVPGIPKPELFGLLINSNQAFALFTFISAIVSITIMSRIICSPFGRLLQATRDDELGLRVLGKDTFTLKGKAMAISGFFAGIAGSLFAHYLSYIDPTSFTLTQIVFILSIVIVGGVASIRGSIIASIILVLIPEVLRFIALPTGAIGPARQMVYAVILMLIVIYKPRGLFGRIDLA